MQKMKILVVDDDQSVSGTLRICAESYGAEVFELNDGASAYQFLKANTVDFILSDIDMPKMDGLNLVSAIRANGIQTPLVLITGNPLYTKEEAIQAGANDLLEKPFSFKSVLLAIETHLNINDY